MNGEDAIRLANQATAGTLLERLGLEFLSIEEDRIVARIPVDGNTQPYGILHGGATAALCETIASMGTAILVGPKRIVVGIELNVNHIRAVDSGHVTATGVPLHLGWNMEVRDDEGKLVAVSRLTLAIREPRTE